MEDQHNITGMSIIVAVHVAIYIVIYGQEQLARTGFLEIYGHIFKALYIL